MSLLELASILSLAVVGTGTVTLGQMAPEQDFEGSDSACLLWFFPRLLVTQNWSSACAMTILLRCTSLTEASSAIEQ